MVEQYDENLLLGYVEGELGEADRSTVEAWAEADPRLRQLLRNMASDRRAMRRIEAPTPPAWLMDEVDRRLERSMLLDEAPIETPIGREPPRRVAGRIGMGVAVAAMVVLSAGVIVVSLWNLGGDRIAVDEDGEARGSGAVAMNDPAPETDATELEDGGKLAEREAPDGRLTDDEPSSGDAFGAGGGGGGVAGGGAADADILREGAEADGPVTAESAPRDRAMDDWTVAEGPASSKDATAAGNGLRGMADRMADDVEAAAGEVEAGLPPAAATEAPAGIARDGSEPALARADRRNAGDDRIGLEASDGRVVLRVQTRDLAWTVDQLESATGRLASARLRPVAQSGQAIASLDQARSASEFGRGRAAARSAKAAYDAEAARDGDGDGDGGEANHRQAAQAPPRIEAAQPSPAAGFEAAEVAEGAAAENARRDKGGVAALDQEAANGARPSTMGAEEVEEIEEAGEAAALVYELRVPADQLDAIVNLLNSAAASDVAAASAAELNDMARNAEPEASKPTQRAMLTRVQQPSPAVKKAQASLVHRHDSRWTYRPRYGEHPAMTPAEARQALRRQRAAREPAPREQPADRADPRGGRAERDGVGAAAASAPDKLAEDVADRPDDYADESVALEAQHDDAEAGGDRGIGREGGNEAEAEAVDTLVVPVFIETYRRLPRVVRGDAPSRPETGAGAGAEPGGKAGAGAGAKAKAEGGIGVGSEAPAEASHEAEAAANAEAEVNAEAEGGAEARSSIGELDDDGGGAAGAEPGAGN